MKKKNKEKQNSTWHPCSLSCGTCLRTAAVPLDVRQQQAGGDTALHTAQGPCLSNEVLQEGADGGKPPADVQIRNNFFYK